jgi:hypothetical protein
MPTDQAQKRGTLQDIAQQANGFLAELPERDHEARKYKTHLESLERLALAEPLTVAELPDWAVEPFTENDGRSDRLGHVCLRLNEDHLDELVALDRRLEALVGAHDVRYADSRLVFADLIGNIELDSRRLPLFAFGIVLVLIWLDVRRPVATVACFSSLVLGVGLALGVMGHAPIHLNFFNLVVMPAVIGLGIDASLHLWHARTRESLSATAKGAILSALTTVAGFSGLLWAEHPGLRSIGTVGVVAIAAGLAMAFLVLYPLRRPR